MGTEILGVLWLIIASVGVLLMVVFIRKYMNEENLAMIEKGMNPKENKHQQPKVASIGALRFALLAVGAGIGLLIGNLLYEVTPVQEQVAYFSMILIFGGIGLVASYVAEQRRIKKLEEKAQ